MLPVFILLISTIEYQTFIYFAGSSHLCDIPALAASIDTAFV